MKYFRYGAALAAIFYCSGAIAQTPGTITNHAFAIGKGAGQQSFTSLLCGAAQLAVGQSAADPICKTLTGDVTMDATGATSIGSGKVTLAKIAAGVLAGDITYWNGTSWVILPGNASGTKVLQETSSGVPSWATLAGTGTVTNVGTSGLASGGPITGSGTITVTAASKSDEQTGTSIVVATTPSQQQQHDSAVKSHGSFTASRTPSISESYNVSSVTSSSAGVFVVNFTTSFASVAYDCRATSVGSPTTTNGTIGVITTKAIGSVGIAMINTSTATGADPGVGVDFDCEGRQ